MPEIPPLPPAGRLGRAVPRAFAPPARRALSLSKILDVALRIVDSEGLAKLTMRAVADELRTGAASLYAHVPNKQTMVSLLLDRVIAEVQIPQQIPPDQWQEQLKDIARSVRSAYAKHGDIARAGLGDIPTGDNSLVLMDRIVGLLLSGGVSERVAALAADMLVLYVTATAFEDSIADYESTDGKDGFHTELKEFFSGLSRSKFPHLVAMAGPLTTGGRTERFEFGLDLVLRGIASTMTGHGSDPA